MRPQRFRSFVWGPLVFAATAAVAFAAAPVSAAPPPNANPAWGDITSVMPGSGLSGGAAEGDATLSVLFGGNGSATTAARSDHDHDARYDARYAPIVHSHDGSEHTHDDLYAALVHNHDDLYAALGHNHDELYAAILHGHDDLYSALNHNHDDRYSALGHSHDELYATLGHDHDELYAALVHGHDDLYSALNHNHDDRYSLLGHNHDGAYSVLGHDHDDRYLGLGGGTLAGLLTMTVGDLTLLGDGARVVAPVLASTAATGTAPFQVASTTKVDNLNADTLDGYDASDFVLAAGGSGPYPLLAGSNAFTGVNTFNAPTTFSNAVNMVTGGANFTFQPFYTSSTAYSFRLVDTGRSAARLVINQDGRVGIGTTSPTFPLHVVGDIRASNLNLGTGVLSPSSFDMSASTERTFAFTNTGTGGAHLSVEGALTAAHISITNGPNASAGRAEIASGSTLRTVATSAVSANSLVFVTPDASQAGCSAVPAVLYVSARSAGTSFTVAVGGAAPGAGESYCFNWWVIN